MFTTLFVQPLFNFLIIIYNYLPWRDLGLSVIILTIFIRIILYPVYRQAAVSQAKINKIQPKIKEIQEKYKNNFAEKTKAIQNIYKENQINPASSFLMIIIQIPILFALYKVFMGGFDVSRLNDLLYHFVDNPGIIQKTLVNIIDISQKNTPLAVLTAITQFIQGKISMPKFAPAQKNNPNSNTKSGLGQEFSKMFTQQMLYAAPIITFFVLVYLPSVLAVYWLANNIFSIIQQYFINKRVFAPDTEANKKIDKTPKN